MVKAKWIGGILGFIATGGSALGTFVGIALGHLFDKAEASCNEGDDNAFCGQSSSHDYAHATDNDSQSSHFSSQQAYTEQQRYEGQRNSFMFSLLVLSAYIIRSDGKVMHSEMEFVRSFLRQNFGTVAAQQGNDILLKLFEHQKQVGETQFRSMIYDSCRQISANMSHEQRLQLLNYLCLIAKADNVVSPEEVTALKEVAHHMGLSDHYVESMLHLQEATTNLDAAYKVLGVDKGASDAELKKAYRRLALENHPDRVATLGEDVRKAAEKKFQEINAAKDLIWKARGI